MKKRIYKMLAVLLWLGLWQAGCYSEKFDPESDEVGPVPTLEFSNASVQLKAAGESGVVTVSTNYKSFRVSVPGEEAAWCHVAVEGMDLKISVDENPGGRERSATISISVAKGSKELTKTISVFQAGTLPLIKASRSVVAFQREEVAAQVVTVETNLDGWEFEQPLGREWFSVTRSGKELTIKTLAASDRKQSRTGYVALQAKDDDREARIMLTVVQFGSEPELRLSEDAFSFEANGGTREIEVMTNQPEWELMGGEGEWYATDVTGNKILLTVVSNPGNPSRDAEIAVFSAKAALVKNINIAQLGTALSLNLSVDTLRFDASESYGTLQVTTNVGEWDAEVAGGADWCRLMKDANKLTVYAETNTDVTLGRESVVTVTSGELSRAVRVIQAPYMTLQLNHDSLEMNVVGETRAVFVSTNQPEWSFRVPEEMKAWYDVVKEGNELRVTTKAIDVRGNVGTIVIAVGKPGMELTTTLTVVQKTSSDRDVLVAFYNATGGEHWTNNTNWCSDQPLSEWYGVTCDEAGRVTAIELRYNKLSGMIPDEIGNLSELETLDLFGSSTAGVNDEGANRLSGNIPASIGALQKLRSLNLGCNQLSGNIPVSLSNLIHLESLCLMSNQLSGNIPPDLSALKNLQVLELDYNQLNGNIPKELGDLENLTNLYLNDNQLTGCVPVELGNLSKLVILELRFNQLSGEIPVVLCGLENLEGLDLEGNQFTGSIPKELGNLRKLDDLRLSSNQIGGMIPVELGRLTNLVWLRLDNNNLRGNVPEELGNLTKLYRDEYEQGGLTLSGNCLTGVFPAEVKALPNWATFNADVHIFPQQEGYGFMSETENLERDALIAFYNAAGGEHWTDNTSWCSDKPLGEWAGVKCNADGRVTELSLRDNGLQGSLAGELGELAFLEVLDLGTDMSLVQNKGVRSGGVHNRLEGQVPASLGKLSHLRRLDLSGNRFVSLLPAELGELTGLTFLSLAGNVFDEVFPAWVCKLVGLEVLNLSYNGFSGNIPPELGLLVGLTILDLGNNNLGGELPKELGSLSNLTEVNLSGNRFTGSIPEEITKLPNWDDFEIFPQQPGYVPELPVVDSYRVTLKLRGDNGEISERGEKSPLYGVQVMSREKGSSGAYEYYAYGIFNDSTAININLPSDREYRFRATMVDDGGAVATESGIYGKPFQVASVSRGVTPLPDYEGGVTGGSGLNTFVVAADKYLAGIDRGETVLAADGKTYTRPNVARYFGERYAYVPTASEEVEVRMTRVIFAVTCEVDSLTSGRIRVEIDGAPYLRVDSKSEVHAVSEVITMGNLDGGWTAGEYSETLNVRFVWEKPNGLERVLDTRKVTFVRNTITKLKVTFKDDGMSMDMENKPLEDGQIYEIEGIIW